MSNQPFTGLTDEEIAELLSGIPEWTDDFGTADLEEPPVIPNTYPDLNEIKYEDVIFNRKKRAGETDWSSEGASNPPPKCPHTKKVKKVLFTSFYHACADCGEDLGD